MSPSRGDQQQDQVNDDLDVSSGSGTAGKEDMTRTLMIGGILGALFALVLAHLIKRLGPA